MCGLSIYRSCSYTCDAGEDFDEFIECLTTHLKDKLVGHRSLVDEMLKVFDEDITPQQLNALSDTEAIKELALVMTHVEESDDEEDFLVNILAEERVRAEILLNSQRPDFWVGFP